MAQPCLSFLAAAGTENGSVCLFVSPTDFFFSFMALLQPLPNADSISEAIHLMSFQGLAIGIWSYVVWLISFFLQVAKSGNSGVLS